MKIGIFSDPHITRKISYLPDRSDNIINTFREMYDYFSKESVDIVVCCGDLFDKSRLLAIDTRLVRDVLSIMSMRETYILSGNHDIGSEDSSIIDILDLVPNLIPVSLKYILKLSEDTNLVFLPYGCNHIEDIPDGSILFTHDEYAGMVINSLGVQSRSKNELPIDRVKVVFNGHIHLPSTNGKMINVGTILPSKFGEMNFGDDIKFYIYDTEKNVISTHILTSPYRFYIADQTNVSSGILDRLLDKEEICLRIDYTDDDFYREYSSKDWSSYRYVTFRKILPESVSSDILLSPKSEIKKVDIPEFIESRISRDSTLSDSMKRDLLSEYPDILVEEV